MTELPEIRDKILPDLLYGDEAEQAGQPWGFWPLRGQCGSAKGDREMKRKLMVLLGCVVFVGLVYPGIAAYATTIVFYSDGVIQEGDVYDKVEVHDTPPFQTTVDMTGGWVGYPGMFSFDTSIVNIAGGFVGFLETNDSSTVNISGGRVGADALGETTISAHDQSTINVSDAGLLAGWSSSVFELLDSSTLNVYRGDVDLVLLAYDSAIVNVCAGKLFDLRLFDGAKLLLQSS